MRTPKPGSPARRNRAQPGRRRRCARSCDWAQTAALSGSALRDRLASATVLARFEPAPELALVKAPQTDGQLVAIAGDGVNYAPAFKAAHIGVAMGKNGADLSDGENARRFTNMDAVS